jgi:hypothetical protein
MSHNLRLLNLFGLTKEAASMAFVRKAVGQSGGIKALTASERKALAGNFAKEIKAANPTISADDLTYQVRQRLAQVAPKSGPSSHVMASRSDAEILQIRKSKAQASKQINKLSRDVESHVQSLRASGLTDEQILKDDTFKGLSKNVQKLKGKLSTYTQNETDRMNKLKSDLASGKGKAKAKLQDSIERARESKRLEMQNLQSKKSLQGKDLQAEITQLENKLTGNKKNDKFINSKINQIKRLQQEQASGVSKDQSRLMASNRLSGKGIPSSLDAQYEQSLMRGSERSALSNINSTGVKNQYEAMLKQKSFVTKAEEAIKKSPELAREYSEHVRRFGKSTPAEFMAQKNIQQQMRIGARGGKTRLDSRGRQLQDGQFLDAQQGFIQTNAQRAGQSRAQDVQLNRAKLEMAQGKAKDEAAFARYQKLTQGEKNIIDNRLGITSNPDVNSYAISRNAKSMEDKLNNQASPIAQRYMKANKGLDQDAAMEMAKKEIRSNKGYVNVPLSGEQRAEQRAFGNVTPIAGNTNQNVKDNAIFSGNIPADKNSLQFKNLNYAQRNNLTNQDPYSVTSSTSKNKVKSKSKGGKDKSEEGESFMGQYGLPLLGGAGLIGAGMLYSNSNSNQPQPSQMSNGV